LYRKFFFYPSPSPPPSPPFAGERRRVRGVNLKDILENGLFFVKDKTDRQLAMGAG